MRAAHTSVECQLLAAIHLWTRLSSTSLQQSQQKSSKTRRSTHGNDDMFRSSELATHEKLESRLPGWYRRRAVQSGEFQGSRTSFASCQDDICRSTQVNTLSKGMMDEFVPLFDRLQNDDQVKGIVVMSAKPGSFIAGADIK